MKEITIGHPIDCPECHKETDPLVTIHAETLISVECTECGYDMKKEIISYI